MTRNFRSWSIGRKPFSPQRERYNYCLFHFKLFHLCFKFVSATDNCFYVPLLNLPSDLAYHVHNRRTTPTISPLLSQASVTFDLSYSLCFICFIFKEIKVRIMLVLYPVCTGESHKGSGKFAIFAIFI